MAASRDVNVRYDGGERLVISIGGHQILTDQPPDGGGGDQGPTPTELLVGSLASCMGFYAQRFLRRNGINPDGMHLSASYTTSERPHRIEAINITVRLPMNTPERLVAPLRRVMETCTVHNTLRQEPTVEVSFGRVYIDDCEAV